MHAVHKIIANHLAGEKRPVAAGEYVEVVPDTWMMGVNRNKTHIRRFQEQLNELGVTAPANPDMVFVYFDHCAPANLAEVAEGQRAYIDFFRSHGYTVPDPGSGISHLRVVEEGRAYPGALVAGQDSHTPTCSAVGCVATTAAGMGLSLWSIGSYWMRVPEVIKVELEGSIPHGVSARDLALHVTGKLGQRAALWKAVEFAGSAVRELNMDGRFTLCCVSTELGSMTGYIQPDDKTFEYLERLGHGSKGDPQYTDPDFEYEQVYRFDVSSLKPQVAKPHAPDNVVDIDAVVGTKIDQAVIGSCANGRLEDLEVAARILKGRKVHPDVRFIVVPGSRHVWLEALRRGYIEIFQEANAVIGNANCGPCANLHQGILSPGEVCITATTRNFQGRMGPGGNVYLGSPATVAASAITGEITDPRPFLN